MNYSFLETFSNFNLRCMLWLQKIWYFFLLKHNNASHFRSEGIGNFYPDSCLSLEEEKPCVSPNDCCSILMWEHFFFLMLEEGIWSCQLGNLEIGTCSCNKLVGWHSVFLFSGRWKVCLLALNSLARFIMMASWQTGLVLFILRYFF